MSARTRHYHRLRLTIDLVDSLLKEIIQHDLRLALDGMRVLPDMFQKQPPPLRRFHLISGRRLLVLQQLEIGAISRVALKHIENETFRDRLAHGVSVKRLVLYLLQAFAVSTSYPGGAFSFSSNSK